MHLSLDNAGILIKRGAIPPEWLKMSKKATEKIIIAIQHLDIAVELALSKKSPYAALTLAGVAEELLGKYLRVSNKQDTLTEIGPILQRAGEIIHNETFPIKDIKKHFNSAKNSVKHMDTYKNSKFTHDVDQELSLMLARAILNYEKLGLPLKESYKKVRE